MNDIHRQLLQLRRADKLFEHASETRLIPMDALRPNQHTPFPSHKIDHRIFICTHARFAYQH